MKVFAFSTIEDSPEQTWPASPQIKTFSTNLRRIYYIFIEFNINYQENSAEALFYITKALYLMSTHSFIHLIHTETFQQECLLQLYVKSETL